MQCTIEGCNAETVAKGMCMRHYMRARRTGNPAVRGKPGPKIGHQRVVIDAAEITITALRQEIAALRQENATLSTDRIALRRKLAQAQAKVQAAARLQSRKGNAPRPRDEEIAALRRQLRQYQARLRR